MTQTDDNFTSENMVSSTTKPSPPALPPPLLISSPNPSSSSSYLQSSLPKQLLMCTLLSIFGWYGPNAIIRPIFGMNMRDIPYQVLKNSGDIVLDPSLNHDVVHDVTITSNILDHTSVTLPILITTTIATLLRPLNNIPKYHDVHSSICTILFCIFLTQFFTPLAKMYVGRLRPNFYGLCGFSIDTLQCQEADENVLREARMSFPSGHSCLSFGSMGCLVWFFLGRSGIGGGGMSDGRRGELGIASPSSYWHPFHHRLRAVKMTLVGRSTGTNDNSNDWIVGILASFIPWIYASFVACSRIVDNWHHPSDVVAGSLMGIFCSTLSYHLWYPYVFSPNAGIPLSYQFQVSNRGTIENEYTMKNDSVIGASC